MPQLRTTVKRVTLDEYRAMARAQGVEKVDVAWRCPMCKCVQSSRDLIAAGAGRNPEEVAKFAGFSCVGRFTGAESPRQEPDGQPCNWTLGGLLNVHEMAIVTEDGTEYPTFELVSPEEAQSHARLGESA